jgi:hypothetical protein
MIVVMPIVSLLTYSDNFDRANGALASPWIERVSWSDTYNISSNQLTRTGTGANEGIDGQDSYVYGTPFSTTNMYAEVDIVTFAGSGANAPGLVLADPAGAFSSPGLFFKIRASGWEIFTAVSASSSRTTLRSGTRTFTAGGKLRVEKLGTKVLMIYKDEVIAAYNGTLPTGLYAGVCVGQGGNVLDNWAAGELEAFTKPYPLLGSIVTYSDNFDAKADGGLAGTSNGWDTISALCEPQVYAVTGGKAIRGEFATPSSRPNTRSQTETVPAASRVNTYVKANILAIGERAGVWLAGGVTAYFTSTTSLVIGTLTGTTSTTTPTVLQTFTVAAVSFPVEVFLASTSTTNVDVYLNGSYVGSATHALTGNSSGVLLSSTTDSLDDFACGTIAP